MFISVKKHREILKDCQVGWQKEIDGLQNDLNDAKNLKAILEKLYPISVSRFIGYTATGSCELLLDDNIPQYIEDLFGGRVIKQEATKAIEIDSKGNVKTGFTKLPADKGRPYKLVQR